MRKALLSGLLLMSCLAILPACGLDTVVSQSGEASLRTLLDLLLTDFANQVANSLTGDTVVNGDDGNDNGSDGGNGGSDDPAVIAGERLMMDNCAACHGSDGASGFAPNIQDAPQSLMAEKAGGAGGHATYDVSTEDIADIAAYLATFGASTGNDPVELGRALVQGTCALCHGVDGGSGFAPNIQGVAAQLITSQTGGANGHPMYELSAADIDNIAAYLATF